MEISPDTLIGKRYKLLECLGAGGMGEVWKAQDTNFTRLVVVAVKLLKEDETAADDARHRTNLARLFRRAAESGQLTPAVVIDALDESFNLGENREALRSTVEARLGAGPVSPEDALAVFDELVQNSAYNQNARHRKRLRDLFAAEANSVAVLQHPNIVRVTDYGDQAGLPFLVMDYISGRTLQQVIQRREPMPMTRRLRLMEDLCEGLAYAHGKDLVHRDIKPANLIIDGDTQRLKILDFGVARPMQVSAQRTLSMGAPIGTFSYMSPEQTRASRTLDNRSDIFSVGLVLYEFLSFQRAFLSRGDIVELIGRIQHDPPPPLRDLVPDLDADIERIVYRAIEKVPARRYQDMIEMQRDLERVRARLEEEEKRQAGTQGLMTHAVKRRPLLQQVTDLVDRATNAFETGDDHAVIEFSDQILALIANQPDAIELKARAESRLRERDVAATLGEGRQLIASGELTSAAELLERAGLDSRLTAVRHFADDLAAARQARRVQTLLRDAGIALDSGAYDEAIARAREALALAPASEPAQRIIDQVESRVADERRQQVDRALQRAASARAGGDLEGAIDQLGGLAGEPEVDAHLEALRHELNQHRDRSAARADAVQRARAFVEAEEFTRAADVVRRARTSDPEDAELLELEIWLGAVVQGLTELDDAIRLFERDDRRAGGGFLRTATEALEPHQDRFPSIRGRLSAGAEAARQAEARAEARKRREAEAAAERQRQQARAEQARVARALADAAARVREAIGRGDFAGAEGELTDLGEIAGSAEAATELRAELGQARARARDEAAATHRQTVRALVVEGELETALAMLHEFQPPHPFIDEEIKVVNRAIQKREDDRRRAADAERLRQEGERARVERERARAVEAERERQEAERARQAAEQARQALEERVDAAIADSDARFAAGDHTHALDVLVAFDPPHHRIAQHLSTLRRRIDELAAEARAAQERERREAERASLMQRAAAAAAARDYGQALELTGAVHRVAPGDADAAALRAQVLLDLRDARAREPANRALRRLLAAHDPATRRRRQMQVLAASAAALVVVGLAALLFDRLQERSPAPIQELPASPTVTVPPNPPVARLPSEERPPVSEPVPPPPAAVPDLSTLTVDLRPWARVRIVPRDSAARGTPDPQLTPFTVSLPAGTYVLRAENDGLTGPLEVTVELDPGKPRLVSRDMPGFNADRVVTTLLGQER